MAYDDSNDPIKDKTARDLLQLVLGVFTVIVAVAAVVTALMDVSGNTVHKNLLSYLSAVLGVCNLLITWTVNGLTKRMPPEQQLGQYNAFNKRLESLQKRLDKAEAENKALQRDVKVLKSSQR